MEEAISNSGTSKSKSGGTEKAVRGRTPARLQRMIQEALKAVARQTPIIEGTSTDVTRALFGEQRRVIINLKTEIKNLKRRIRQKDKRIEELRALITTPDEKSSSKSPDIDKISNVNPSSSPRQDPLSAGTSTSPSSKGGPMMSPIPSHPAAANESSHMSNREMEDLWRGADSTLPPSTSAEMSTSREHVNHQQQQHQQHQQPQQQQQQLHQPQQQQQQQQQQHQQQLQQPQQQQQQQHQKQLQEEEQNMIRCPSCGTVLVVPPNCGVIQCGRCQAHIRVPHMEIIQRIPQENNRGFKKQRLNMAGDAAPNN